MFAALFELVCGTSTTYTHSSRLSECASLYLPNSSAQSALSSSFQYETRGLCKLVDTLTVHVSPGSRTDGTTSKDEQEGMAALHSRLMALFVCVQC